jgi:hypothetical protein
MRRPGERTQALSAWTGTLTAVSRCSLKSLEKSGHSRLARHSLGLKLTMSLFGAGCMVTGSPDFAEPQMSKPYLTADSPEPWTVVALKGIGTPPTYQLPPLKFEIASEDLNTRGVLVQLVSDYPGPVATGTDNVKGVLNSPVKILPPGHLGPGEIVTRTQLIDSVPLLLGTAPGCHSITLFASHGFKLNTVLPETDGDLGTLTWWVFAQDPSGQTPTSENLADCLTAGTTNAGDGG